MWKAGRADMTLDHCILLPASFSVDFLDDQFIYLQAGHHPQLVPCQCLKLVSKYWWPINSENVCLLTLTPMMAGSFSPLPSASAAASGGGRMTSKKTLLPHFLQKLCLTMLFAKQ